MFDIQKRPDGSFALSGRLDAAQAPRIQEFVATAVGDIVIDFTDLEYISSSGLGQMVALHQKLAKSGNTVTLRSMPQQVRYVFHLARLDTVLKIE
jgi:anti-sigma B factor antagonist